MGRRMTLVDIEKQQSTRSCQDPTGYDTFVQVQQAPEPPPPKRPEQTQIPPEDTSEQFFRYLRINATEATDWR
ncbi:hypothetical protein AVEN_130112-1, partial [Araneus ventricosus]